MVRIHDKLEPIVLETITQTAEIPVNEGNVFVFPEGVPAFEEYRQFVLCCDEEVQPFFFLKSVGISPEISFVCVDPYLVNSDYKVRLGSADLKTLGLGSKKDAFVFSAVTVRDNPEDITANLIGPFVLNLKNCTGKQVVNENARYSVRTRIWDKINELKENKKEEEACLAVA